MPRNRNPQNKKLNRKKSEVDDDDDENVHASSIFDLQPKNKKCKKSSSMDTSFEQAVIKADNIQKLRKQLFPSIQSHQEFIENLAEQEKEEKEAAVLVENRTLDPAIVQARQLLFSYFFKKVSQRLNYKCVNLGPILTAIHSLLKTMKEHPDVESIELDLKQMIGNLETCQPSLPSDDCPNYVRLPAALFYLIYLKHIGKLPANKIDLEGLLTSVAGCLNSHPSEHSSRQPLLLLNVFIAFYTSWKIVSDYIDQKGANLLPGYNGISHLEELFTLSSKLFDFYGKYLALLAPFTVPDDSITYFFVAVYDFLLKQAYFYRGVAINKIESTYKSFVEALLNIDNNETEKIRRFFSTIGAIQLFPEYHDDNCIFVGSYYLLMKTMPRSLDYAQPYLAGLLFLATLKKRPSSSMKETGILINFEAIHDTIGEMATTNLSADVYPSIHSAIQFIVYDLAHANHKLFDLVIALMKPGGIVNNTIDNRISLARLLEILSIRLKRPIPPAVGLELGSFMQKNSRL